MRCNMCFHNTRPRDHPFPERGSRPRQGKPSAACGLLTTLAEGGSRRSELAPQSGKGPAPRPGSRPMPALRLLCGGRGHSEAHGHTKRATAPGEQRCLWPKPTWAGRQGQKRACQLLSGGTGVSSMQPHAAPYPRTQRTGHSTCGGRPAGNAAGPSGRGLTSGWGLRPRPLSEQHPHEALQGPGPGFETRDAHGRTEGGRSQSEGHSASTEAARKPQTPAGGQEGRGPDGTWPRVCAAPHLAAHRAASCLARALSLARLGGETERAVPDTRGKSEPKAPCAWPSDCRGQIRRPPQDAHLGHSAHVLHGGPLVRELGEGPLNLGDDGVRVRRVLRPTAGEVEGGNALAGGWRPGLLLPRLHLGDRTRGGRVRPGAPVCALMGRV